MKCICGYEDITIDKENSTRVVNEKFIAISTIDERKFFRWDKAKDCYLFACPKCGALKIYI